MSITTATKRCPECRETLLATSEYFNADKNRPMKLGAYCRECSNTDARQRRQRNRARESDTISVGKERLCHGCELTLPLDAENFHRNRNNTEGFAWYCKKCAYAATVKSRNKNRDEYNRLQAIRSMRRHHASRPDLMRNFGITKAEFDAIAHRQGGRCLICKTTPQSLCVDHDHATGKIRGLLCHSCNLGIGNMRDDPELLNSAIAYLRGDL